MITVNDFHKSGWTQTQPTWKMSVFIWTGYQTMVSSCQFVAGLTCHCSRPVVPKILMPCWYIIDHYRHISRSYKTESVTNACCSIPIVIWISNHWLEYELSSPRSSCTQPTHVSLRLRQWHVEDAQGTAIRRGGKMCQGYDSPPIVTV